VVIEKGKTAGAVLASYRKKYRKFCSECGGSFVGISTKETCGEPCRKKRSRKRKKLIAEITT